MKIQLIHGQFIAQDALELISKMINAKIKFHESRITNTCSEEDIKMRERKIKHLQKDLFEARNYISTEQIINLESEIFLNN
ncbi:hypothetical protein [Flavobacterium sp.]|uniref:hypothetical protein n=1 Tax=Flavobacterium sp. TaxID=239 RepID=UPI003750691B